MDRVVKGNIVSGTEHPGIQGKEVTTARREKAGVGGMGGVGRVKQNWVQTQTALCKSVDIPVSQLPSLRTWGTTGTGEGCTHCVCTVHKHPCFSSPLFFSLSKEEGIQLPVGEAKFPWP